MVKQQYSRRSGFSLIELAIVMVMIAVLVSGAMTLGRAVVDRTEYQVTDAKLEELVQAIRYYHRLYGRLPCPAARTLATSDSNFGKEIFPTTCASDTSPNPSGTIRVDAGSSKWVRIGALPVRDMGLDDTMIRDEFGQRYTYVVMQNMTQSGATYYDNVATTGNITVNDGMGNVIASDIAFALISHGEDARGGYKYVEATVVGTCGTTKRDHENCDDDALFTDSLHNVSTTDSVFFDDRVRWMVKNAIAP